VEGGGGIGPYKLSEEGINLHPRYLQGCVYGALIVGPIKGGRTRAPTPPHAI